MTAVLFSPLWDIPLVPHVSVGAFVFSTWLVSEHRALSWRAVSYLVCLIKARTWVVSCREKSAGTPDVSMLPSILASFHIHMSLSESWLITSAYKSCVLSLATPCLSGTFFVRYMVALPYLFCRHSKKP